MPGLWVVWFPWVVPFVGLVACAMVVGCSMLFSLFAFARVVGGVLVCLSFVRGVGLVFLQLVSLLTCWWGMVCCFVVLCVLVLPAPPSRGEGFCHLSSGFVSG